MSLPARDTENDVNRVYAVNHDRPPVDAPAPYQEALTLQELVLVLV